MSLTKPTRVKFSKVLTLDFKPASWCVHEPYYPMGTRAGWFLPRKWPAFVTAKNWSVKYTETCAPSPNS